MLKGVHQDHIDALARAIADARDTSGTHIGAVLDPDGVATVCGTIGMLTTHPDKATCPACKRGWPIVKAAVEAERARKAAAS